MKIFILSVICLFVFGGCAEGNLGWGFGSGSQSAGHNRLITLSEREVKLYAFKSPLNEAGDWRQTYDHFKTHKTYFEDESYGISLNWVGFSTRYNLHQKKPRIGSLYNDANVYQNVYLDLYLNALTGKISLEEAHTAYFSAFYPSSTVLFQEQRKVKGVQCMQTKAMYNKEYLVELQCPVFFRHTFGTITYLMHTMGGGNTINDIDQNMTDFNHMIDTLEFIEPPSQKIPEGFSLDEQFKRIQEPNWQL